MKALFIAFVFFISFNAVAEGDFATNSPEVFVKNFTCSGTRATFNVVNKSNKTITAVNINIFDSAGDPIDQKTIYDFYISPNSGKEVYKDYMNCSKIQRVGFSVRF